MKLHNNDNNTFIITSNDVLVNGKKSDILTNIIDDQDNKLNKLEKNVKWLYKYGGTGSKGSGSSGSSKLSVDANILFGNSVIKKLNDQKIIISNNTKDYETLSITLSSANILNTYRVRITHGGSIINETSTGNKDWTLDQNNDFSISLNIPLDETGNVIIQLTASSQLTGEQISEQYKFTYIKNPYVINLSIINDDNENIIDNGNLYVNTAKEEGVNFYVNYNIASTKPISYEITCDTDNMLFNNTGIINDNEHGVGLGSLKIPFNNDFVINDNNYGYHTINIKLKINPDESLGIITGQIMSINISFTYIPNDRIFFKVEPVNNDAKIYKYNINSYNNAIINFNLYKQYYGYFIILDNEQVLDEDIRETLINDLVDESEHNTITDTQLKEILKNKLNEIEADTYIYNIGSLQLYIQAYNGSKTLQSVDVSYILTQENIEDSEGVSLLDSLKYRDRQLVNIPIHEEGVYKLCIYSKEQNVNDYIVYYFIAFDKNSGINWYNADVEFNKINLYYRQGKIGTHTKTDISYIQKYENITKIQKYSNGQPSELFNITNEINNSEFNPECDIMVSLGIQYSYINDNNKTLMSILTNDPDSSLNLDIYQNKITTQGSPSVLANIFIPKEHNYAPGNNDNYHLLTLYKRYIYETSKPYYEIIVYIDGCPEAAFGNFIQDSSCWSSILLNNSNLSLNFFEISYFKHNRESKTRFDKNELSNTIIQNKVTYLDDIAISEYYYKYVSSRKNLNSIISLLPNLRNFKETNYGMIEVASKVDIDSIANLTDIPVLLFEYSEQSNNEFVKWFTKSYKENELTKDKKRLDKLFYSPGLNKLSQINLPSILGDSYWYIALQGSSTGEFFDKNLTLGIVNSTVGYMGIFTPNFYDISSEMFNNYNNLSESDKEKVIKAKNSFLPETAYTLKADVVDSSHSNNTCVGAFVNANTTQFDILFDNGSTNKGNNKYVNYIKNCLLGFPVLVFINVKFGDKSNYYFLGIYNFNLGRDSYFNMGYYSPKVLTQSQIVDTLNNANGNTFKVTYVSLNNEQNSVLPVDDGVIVAEIQGGKEYFDFSQYHDTILLPQQVSQGSDTGCMFGDFVPNYDPYKSSNADLRIRYHIPRLVKSIAKAGGYLFSNVLQKHLGEYSYRYNKYIDKGQSTSIFDSANQVPNYLLQYVRAPQEADTDLQYLIYNFKKENGNIVLDENGQPSIDTSYAGNDMDVGRLIDAYIDAENPDAYGRGEKPILDYTSLTEYYTVCMGFGLVDSVMKNLNVKTWNATYSENSDNNKTGTWYVAFYDMDTSFGRDNGGSKTSYFAFSDYWKTSKSSELEQPTIYRDFYPKSDPNNPYTEGQSMKESGFDIPSSYLFAVAKYAHLLNSNNEGEHSLVPTDSIPHNIWARWRNVDDTSGLGLGHGELRSADYFINKYFIRNLDNIPEQLWALNYRFKYLKRIVIDDSGEYNYVYNTNENGSFENINYTPFHGKGINELHEWLNGRLHILDSYFNLEGNNQLNIKYLQYKTKESEEPLYQFTPIEKVDGIKGYIWNDIQEPIYSDSLSDYMWLPTNYYEYVPNITSDTLGHNQDIEILKDIFSTSGNGARYGQPIDLYIKAQEYAPFNITTAMGEKSKYLLEDPNKEYHIKYNPSGLQITKFGGSTLWTYIKNLNTVINENSLTLNTEALDQIILTRGNVSKYNISNMKSLKYVSIIKDLYDYDSNFSGTLIFKANDNEDPYPDLTSIELVRTEITLTVNGEGVRNINLTGTKSQNTNIENCKNLESVSLTGFTAPLLNITPGWSNEMSIYGSKVTYMKLSPKDSNDLNASIDISNDTELTSIVLNHFKNITITNCPNLRNICILNPEEIKKLNIIRCNTNINKINKINQLNICFNESDIRTDTDITTDNEWNNYSINGDYTIDLTNFTSIRSFKFNGTLGFTIIDISNSNGESITTINGNTYNCIRLYSNAFSDTPLTQIKTKPNVYLYIDSDNNGLTETFSNSGYNINNNQLIIGKNVKKLNKLFCYGFGGGNYSNPNMTSVNAQKFLTADEQVVIFENIDNIESLEYMFYGQSGVNISAGTLGETFSLSKFKNVKDISYMFFGTSSFTFKKEFFGNELEYCGQNIINLNKEFNLNCFIPTTCSISIDVFDFYINNIKNLISDDNTYINITYNFDLLNIDYTNENHIVYIKDLFSKLNSNNILESFIGFNIDKKYKTDWSSLLYDYETNTKKFPKLNTIRNSFSSENINNIGYNDIGLNKYDLSLFTLYNSFNYSSKSKERINIATIINYDKLPISNGYALIPWYDKVKSLNCSKVINETEIIPLLQKLDDHNCIVLNGLFANTNIIVDTNKQNINELILSDNNKLNYNFTVCSELFSNAKFIDNNDLDDKGNPHIYGFEITENTLKTFNKVVNWSKAFYNCTLHKNLPLNMFNLKNSENEYLIANYNGIITDVSSMFENVKLDSNQTWFAYDWETNDPNYTYNNNIPLNGSYHYKINAYNSVNPNQNIIFTNPESKDVFKTNDDIEIYGSNIIKNLVLPWDIFYGCTNSCNIDNFIANSDFEGILPANLFPINSRISYLNLNNTFKNVLIVPNYYRNVVLEYNKTTIDNISYYNYVSVPAYIFVPQTFITQSTSLTNGLNFKMLLPLSGSLDAISQDQYKKYEIEDNEGIIIKEYTIIDNEGTIELYFILNSDSINFNKLESIQKILPIDVSIKKLNIEGNYEEISLHNIENFNSRNDYKIHYHMYFNNDIDNDNYDWIIDINTFKDISDESRKAINQQTDTGLPIPNTNTKLLYQTIFDENIISFAYGPIISNNINLANLRPINNSTPIITMSGEWSNFGHNVILPLNNGANNGYYENALIVDGYARQLSINNMARNSRPSLDNYIILGNNRISEDNS